MNRRYKVKHYRSRIYNPIKGKIIRIVAIIAALAALFAIGWFAYEPIMEAINNKNKEIILEDPIPEKPPEPVYVPEPVDFLEKETVAVTVPEEQLYSSLDFYTFLKALDDDVTAIIIDMKTKEGTVTYNSKQVSVINAGAVAEKAVDIEKRIKTAKDLGFDVVARIYAFEDSTAPYNSDDMAIRYQSEDGVLWLDDSIDNGGKPWLNPYSDTAQKYVLDIVFDAIDFEVDAVLLDGLRFPEDEGMDYAYFGVGAEGVEKGEILSQFAQRIYSTAVLTETDIIIGYDALAVIEGRNIYGANPTEFIADGYAPYINLNDFIGVKFGDGYNFKKMPEDITELFTAVYESLGSIAGLKIMPVIECEGFIKSQMKAPIEFVLEKGAVGYILNYNEAFFSGIPEVPEEQEQQTPAAPQTPVNPAPQVPVTPSVPVTPEPEPEPEEEENENFYPEQPEEDEDEGSHVVKLPDGM
ncbi:MAG: hypothetical protein IKU42_00910 [Oscillospiraceae bacterium]|nr:hypothetical protein [Oscillospiraceae bacterium]